MDAVLKILILLAFFHTLLLLPSQDRDFGLGGTTSGRATAVTAETDNAFAAIYNPALISAQTEPSFSFSSGASQASYASLGVVRVDSRDYRTQVGEDRSEPYSLPESRFTTWAAGFTYPFHLPFFFSRRAGFGLTASGPYQKLRSIYAGTPYDFSTLRYGTSDAQFKGTMSGSIELWPDHFFFGMGLSVYLTTAGAAEATFLGDNPTGRMAVEVGFNTAAIAGFFAQFENTGAGLVLRQAIHPTFDQKFNGNIQLSKETTFRQPFSLHTSMFYEPASAEIDLQHQFGWWKGSLGVSYQWWDGYQPSSLVLSAPDADGKVRSTQVPPQSLKNTWNPRLSLEVPTFQNRWIFAGGYQYRPSPVTDTSGAGNLLDSDTHVVGLSLRHDLAQSEWFPVPISLSVYGQRHWIMSRKVSKTNANFIGAPGYLFSGNAYTYGFTLQARL